ncbi:MAG: carbamoyltransferase [Rubricoccaceae bacterium]
MTVLGLSCFYHDSAAALVRDGRVVAAAQEERFTRRKHDAGFPERAVAYCLAEAGLAARDLDAVAFYDKPLLKFERLLETYLSFAPRGLASFVKAMPVWIKQKLWISDLLARKLGYEGPLVFPEHHESHAASAFFPSPFEEAAFVTTDGVGEWATTSWGTGAGNRLAIRQEIHFPHSLGLLYSAFTYFCGFRVNSGEYKLMGLAPYGTPRYAERIRQHLIDLRPDGSFRLDQDYFTYAHGLTMTGRRFAELFGGPPRTPEGPLTAREMDLAASVQVVTEEAVLAMARHVHAQTGADALCLAGGVALNCVANGRLLREGPFRRVWAQPAAGDAGGALGAALMAAHHWADAPRTPDPDDAMQGAYLGPAFSGEAIAAALRAEGLPAVPLPEDALLARTADLLAGGAAVGWFQGRMEFGPRALGARSILADPRGADVQRRVNLKIKFRESFRPFAPSVIAERADELFALGRAGEPPPESPYMLLVGPVRGAEVAGEGFERLGRIASPVPAVTHVDGSARVQTVTEARNGLYYRLLKAFEARTGCPALVNTSFNVRGEPIVGTPADAIRCFRQTHLDALAIGPFVVTKAECPPGWATTLSAEEVAAEYGLD